MFIPRANALIVFLSLLFGWGCASPQLRKWEGKKITLCCPQYVCNDSSWRESVSKHCKGTSKQIGGEIIEKITGYVSENKTQYGSNSRQEKTSTSANKEYEDCRIFECSTELEGQ